MVNNYHKKSNLPKESKMGSACEQGGGEAKEKTSKFIQENQIQTLNKTIVDQQKTWQRKGFKGWGGKKPQRT